MLIPLDTRQSDIPCSVADCVLPHGTSLLACSEISDAITQDSFQEGERLSVDGHDSRWISVIAVGAVSMEWALTEGRRHVVDFLFRGDILSAPPTNQDLEAYALSDGVVYNVERTAYDQCRRRRHAEGNWQTSLIGAQLNQVTTQTLLLGRLTAAEKLASFLLLLARRIGTQVNGETHIKLPMSREYIADYLGLNSETVSRQLSRLKKDGIIRLPKPGQVEIIAEDRLSELSPLN